MRTVIHLDGNRRADVDMQPSENAADRKTQVMNAKRGGPLHVDSVFEVSLNVADGVRRERGRRYPGHPAAAPGARLAARAARVLMPPAIGRTSAIQVRIRWRRHGRSTAHAGLGR
jgi:hypothetical protein